MSYAGIQNSHNFITVQACGLKTIPQRVTVGACIEQVRSPSNNMCQFKSFCTCIPTYSSLCSGCKCLAAGRSYEGLLAEVFTIWWRHTSLQFPVIAQSMMSVVSCGHSSHLRLIPDLGKCFSGHSNCPKWILRFLVYHFLQQVFQEYNTLGYWMYYSVKCFVVTPSLHQCTLIQRHLHQGVVTKQCLCTSHFHRAVQNELFVFSSSFSQSS